MLANNEIRKQFIDFFVKKGHTAVPPAPLVPNNDPTLLFTNAGMNQFKDVFLGTGSRPYKRAVNSQKCLRAGGKHNDLEEVGKDDYHHTFFEMLGNWSFGDYYMREAIKWAWELLTDVWKIPKDRLYVTVHNDDEESYNIWEEVTDISSERILKFGDKDNFWEMAETGPCGYCSEIHYDRGLHHCKKIANNMSHQCEINGDCGRFVEIWNLVFIEYNRLANGKLVDLPNKHVDTGAGFERLAAILQNKESNYHTDLFMPIINHLEELSGEKFAIEHLSDNEKKLQAFRVIADHIRALTFAIADGVLPSNEGRGYVIRRILRRAARFGRILNLHKPFLYKLAYDVIGSMGDYYYELKAKNEHITLVIKSEEERFNQTLDAGIIKFNEVLERLKPGSTISGKEAFRLYDTYGFPLDLTRLMAEEKGFSLDEKGFEKEMEKQKRLARESGEFEWQEDEFIQNLKISPELKTEFVGYSNFSTEGRVLLAQTDTQNHVAIILDKTPFYAESGGQIADRGVIHNTSTEIQIESVQIYNNVYIHLGKLIKGDIKAGDTVIAEIDKVHRTNIAKNHTATHLLHAALREVLGSHVHQKGSLVLPDRLRFDFTHFRALTEDQLAQVEALVNKKIRENLPITTKQEKLENARAKGAMALFGEKYENEVRVVEINKYSLELCGGTHCHYTGEIGVFKIVSESSIAAGVRRIEALTGEYAYESFREAENVLTTLQEKLQCPRDGLEEKVERLLEENRELQKRLEKFEFKTITENLDKLLENGFNIQNITVVAGKVAVTSTQQLREAADYLRSKLDNTNAIGLLATIIEGKASLICVVSPKLKKKYHAGKIVNNAAKIIGGKGGGRPDMAMAGGKNIENLDKIFLPDTLEKIISAN
jgi:alanyl-tRNA synthetase